MSISIKEILEQFKAWGINPIENIEEEIERELTEDEIKKIIIYSIGFCDFDSCQNQIIEDCLDL